MNTTPDASMDDGAQTTAAAATGGTSRGTRLDALAEHYQGTDTSAQLGQASAVSAALPPALGEPMTTFAVRLPVPVLARVREIAGQQDLTTSTLIRRWIEAGAAADAPDSGERAVPVHALLELIGRAGHAPTQHVPSAGAGG